MYYFQMTINYIFENNLCEAKRYYDLGRSLFVTNKKGERVLPFFYYVPADLIEIERVNQGTQKRLPSDEVENDSTHLCTQSIVFICDLLGLSCLFCFFLVIIVGRPNGLLLRWKQENPKIQNRILSLFLKLLNSNMVKQKAFQ